MYYCLLYGGYSACHRAGKVQVLPQTRDEANARLFDCHSDQKRRAVFYETRSKRYFVYIEHDRHVWRDNCCCEENSVYLDVNIMPLERVPGCTSLDYDTTVMRSIILLNTVV